MIWIQWPMDAIYVIKFIIRPVEIRIVSFSAYIFVQGTKYINRLNK